jgi:nucleoside-diphosphate-sugar epimerase
MRALITGAGGFIGHHLSLLLNTQGVEIHTLGPRPVSARHHRVDPSDFPSLVDAVCAIRPSAVFHLAGVTASPDPTVYYRVNTAFAAGLLAALEQSGQGMTPVLLVGSAAEYGSIGPDALPICEETPGHPAADYGISKLAQTYLGLAAAADGRPIVIARPFNIIGPRMPTHLAVGSFTMQIAAIIRGNMAPVLRVGNLAPSRDLIDVRDVARLFVTLLNTPEAFGRVVNICTGVPTSMRTVVAHLIALAGVEIAIEHDETRIRGGEIPVHYGNNALLTKLTGPLALWPIHASLRDTLESVLNDSRT